ncbi:MAG: ATP-binding protein [Methanomassiliicoccaceae archaeon]|jgi:predicted AAA+ superfamily ATPase|nr:ATP-binding protein [Methanomassiliicoccaceae archaeon]
MNKPIERKIYTDRILSFLDKEPIKIITGIRRSGKSEILKLIKQEILKHNDEEHIIFINFESDEFEDIASYRDLNEYVTEKMRDDKKYYILLDEVQEVEHWEKSVNSLRLKNTDIYITGSNSKLLSGEFATLLSGRYVSFEVNTLSFAEFIKFRREYGLSLRDANEGSIRDDSEYPMNVLNDELDAFLRIGGFPLLSTSRFTLGQARQTVADIHSSIVFKDVVVRHRIRNVPLLERIVAFIYDNIGNLVSIRKITDYLNSTGSGAGFETVSNYLGHLEEACIIRKVSRYDIKGKRLLESNNKYYLADHSLQYAVISMRRTNIPGILENIVFNDLMRRGYKVYMGKMSKDDNREIDFVAEMVTGDDRIYVQICTEYGTYETMEREFTPLTEIKDHHPKYVVTMDRFWEENRNGVTGIHLRDFLLKDRY